MLLLASNKEVIDILQSATNSSVECRFSRDGQKLWSLAENGEVMCFDLRQMRAINTFSDMPGATSLGKIKMKLFEKNNFAFLFCNFVKEK